MLSSIQPQPSVQGDGNADDTLDQARRTAERLLARRAHSTSELAEKLRARGFSAPVITPLIEELCARSWLDDAAFAARFAAIKAERLYGPQRITQQLKQLGIDDTNIRQALRLLNVDWCELADLCLHKRFGAPSDQSRIRLKQQRYLYQRGYQPEHFGLLFR